MFLLFLIDIPQALSNSHKNLYPDDASIFYEHNDVTNIENFLNTKFAFVEDEATLCILFSKDKNLSKLNITTITIELKNIIWWNILVVVLTPA